MNRLVLAAGSHSCARQARAHKAVGRSPALWSTPTARRSQMLRFRPPTRTQKRFTKPPAPSRAITRWQRCRQAPTTSRSTLQDSTRATGKTYPSAQRNRCAWMFTCSNTSWALWATGANSEFNSPVRIRRHRGPRREPRTANPTSPASGSRKERWIPASRSLCPGPKRLLKRTSRKQREGRSRSALPAARHHQRGGFVSLQTGSNAHPAGDALRG